MKEYLIKDPQTGKYWVSNSKDYGFVCDVPEGAEIALYFENATDKVVFYKNDGKSHASIDTKFKWKHDSLWSTEDLLDENYSKDGISFKHTVVWQRKTTSTLIEYLNPADWSLHVVDVDNGAAGEDWIKVPEGAIKLLYSSMNNSHYHFVNNLGQLMALYDIKNNNEYWYGDAYSYEAIASVVWQRHTQPEELPFVDDEPKHQHYFKDFSDCKKVDVYRVLDRFNVMHPCQQHIAKKALCAGNRGHKDLLRDIQDIIDTAERWKEMLLEDSRDGEG